MRRLTAGVIAGAAAGLLAVGTIGSAAGAAPSDGHPATKTTSKVQPARAHAEDDLPSPLSDKRRELMQQAAKKQAQGTITPKRVGKSDVVKMGKRADGKNQYVETSSTRTDEIFTVLVSFGDQTDPRTGGTPGPANGQIKQPDRNWNGDSTDDNSTYWVPNFDTQHYKDMFFGKKDSFKDFYEHQSSGKFSVSGDVSGWVTVPYNEARYGSNEIPETDGYWNLVRDSVNAWYAAEKQQGATDEEIASYLSRFDKWDRYDYDGDGNFDEPDGYLDHIEIVHAGEGEEAGGGPQGADAVWSHRWYAYSTDQGKTGPDGNLLGGTQVGDAPYWVGDYTTEPENGGLGVFCHEFGHDLGLPDEYDTAGGDNSTGFWTLMSSGSWLGKGFDSIGTTPGYMNAWDKYQLGWLDYAVVPYQGAKTKVTLGAAARQGKNPQALVVTLPEQTITHDYNTPASGSYEWWGGAADNLSSSLTRELDLTGASSASISTKAWYDIEEGYDFLLAEVSTDGGTHWTSLNGDGITGSSNNAWTDVSYDLSAYAGQKVLFHWQYKTDGGVHYAGAFLDDLALTVDGATAWTDDVESADPAWTADGFSRMTGSTSEQKARFYIAENRQYVDYDDTLRTGPYNFGFGDTKADWVEHFPYQKGLLIWYVNYAYEDNNTSTHPGGGLVLPVDAHPGALFWSDGKAVSNRIQPWDATFGTSKTPALNLHHAGGATLSLPAQKAAKTFDDSNVDRYYDPQNPQGSVKVAGSGTQITVTKQAKNGNLTVQVSFK
ncbi:immune inhibitor A domain-containing protein [Actinocatenispora comari]|uniref:Protease n=1 Tax=Actinocatenispora comari TaxID=2807577 RepID=A0A8J4AH14_9ACTN|nr:immune inhibitor A domain-containing protein [Actinocatenispora comari]GIL29532.1 protease [Actinocatenispora comari]